MYIVALGLIAALAIGGQVLVQRALTVQGEDGSLINEAGRQRMLSQRIVMSTLAVENEASPALRQRRLNDIVTALDTWTATAVRLETHAAQDARRAGLADLLRKARPPMDRMVAAARTVVNDADQTPAAASLLLADEELFLPLMDAIVYWLELDSTRRVAMLRQLEFILLGVTLVVLVLEALLIFRPAVARLRTTMNQLEVRQEQTRRRLDSLRHLAGGLAHHFNNLLFGVTGYAELLKRDARQNHRSVEYIDAQLDNCQRAMQLTHQLLAYSGYGKLELRPTHLADLVHEVLTESVPSASPVKLDLQVREDTRLQIDQREIRKALGGLIANAVEAMEDRPGRVRIVVDQTIVDEPLVAAGPYQQELPTGLYARVRVVDQGCGMTAAQLERIFDPFYSTKTFGRGLGMSATLGIAHAHGGGVVVRSRPDEGSEAILYLPVETAAAASDSPPAERKRVDAVM